MSGATAGTQEQAWDAYEAFGARLRRDPPASDRAGDAMSPGDPWRPFVDALSGFMNGAGDRPALGRRLPRLRRRGERHQLAAARRLRRLHRRPRRRPARRPRNPRHRDLGGAAHPARHRSRTDRGAGGDRRGLDRGAGQRRDPLRSARPTIISHAASRLPLGLADKIFLSLAEPDAVPPESHLLGRFDSARTGSYYLRPFGRPVVECFLGGVLARELEAAGEAAAVAFVTDELRALLGADFARGLAPLAVTAWGREPTILGSYSHALPGSADARAVLARPVSPRLCFAGEACSPRDFSTAHGAWETGIAAADQIAAAL